MLLHLSCRLLLGCSRYILGYSGWLFTIFCDSYVVDRIFLTVARELLRRCYGVSWWLLGICHAVAVVFWVTVYCLVSICG